MSSSQTRWDLGTTMRTTTWRILQLRLKMTKFTSTEVKLLFI